MADANLEEYNEIIDCEITCDSGWFSLIKEVCDHIKTENPGFKIVQIKEKFGLLRIYTEPRYNNKPTQDAWNRLSKVVRWAEHKSAFMCEICGNVGKIDHSRGWIKTHCSYCAEKCK